MLVLSRKLGEEIVVGENIHLTVVSIRGNQVRLGFTAPTEVVIQRAELSHPPTQTVASNLILKKASGDQLLSDPVLQRSKPQ